MSILKRFGRVGILCAMVLLTGWPAISHGAAYDGWGKQLVIRFATPLPGPLTNFPVLVTLDPIVISGFNYADFGSPADGADLRFSDSSGETGLYYEIESWNTNGASFVWVQAPSIASTNDAIMARWGKSGETALPCTTNGAVWGSNHLAVYHMNATNGATKIRDYSAYRKDATIMATTNVLNGLIGLAQGYNGTSAYLQGPTNLVGYGVGSSFTLSAWVKSTATGLQCLLADGTTYQNAYGYLFVNPTNQAAYGLRTGVGGTSWAGYDSVPVPCTTGAWHLVTQRYDGTSVQLFFDGVFKYTLAQSGVVYGGVNALSIGWRTAGEYMKGAMDEVRISSSAASSNWIYACWFSQVSNSAFTAFGAVEDSAKPGIANIAVSNVTLAGALLTGSLSSTGKAETVVGVAYGTADGATDMGAWGVTRILDTCTVSVLPVAYTTVASVDAGSNYFYRFWASNSFGLSWASSAGQWLAGEVSVASADPAASETGSVAVITLARPEWSTNLPLQVGYAMSGMAINGADYTNLTGSVTFPAGASNATVTIRPGNDILLEGTETAVLTLSPGAYVLGASSNASVNILDSQTMRFVATNGAHTAPFDSWVNAATSIQAAVDYALPGDTILVGDGVYSLYAATNKYLVTVSNDITLKSLNGPAAAIIDCKVGTTSTDRHTLWLKPTATNALVAGFTLKGVYWLGTSTDNSPVRMNAGAISNCIVASNTVVGGVGGVRITGGRLVDCVIRDNLSTEWQNAYGGGVNLSGGIVERCLIVTNTTTSHRGGAGVYMTAGTLRNCVIVKNQASYWSLDRDPVTQYGKGGGVFMSGGRVENCTLAGNYSIDKGAGLYATGGAVSNTIVYFNTTPERQPLATRDLYLSATVFSNGCSPYAVGAGNITGDPQFANAATGNYTLLPGSPCIDAGKTLAFAEDKNVTARPAGPAWDIGAYETPVSAASPFTCNFSAPLTEATGSLTVDFTAFVAGADTTITHYRWQFGDGAESNGPALPTVSHAYTTGWHTVTLTVSNASAETASLSKTAYIKVNPLVLYVEKTGSHTFPYDTPVRAATNIQSAVQAAVTGATVIIGDGVWAMASQVALEKPIRVRSANGPANCTSTVPGMARSFYLYHTNAILEGLTITKPAAVGYGLDGAGVYMIQGLVTNCAFKNIVMAGYGGGVWMAAGTVSDCLMVSNKTTEWQYGYGAGLYISSQTLFGPALVEKTRFLFNESQSWKGGGAVHMTRGTLRNCLVVSNSCTRPTVGSQGIGGGVYMSGGSMENCTVVTNFSVSSGGGLYMTGSAAVTNSIVYFNTVSVAPAGERNLYKSGGSIGYSCIDPAPLGTANTALDPTFENAAAYDYHPKAGSPCVDQGVNQAWMTTARDLDGAIRKQNSVVDMGCYESPDPWSGPLISGFSATPSAGFLSAEVVFTAAPVGLDTNIVNYWWAFGDGNTAAGADKATVTNTYPAGYFDVSLIMVNQSGEYATNTKTAYIKVAPQTAYVATNGTPQAPYMTWQTAAATLQDALAVVNWAPGGAHTVVAVTTGVYNVGAQITLATNYTIRGMGDVSNVVVQGSASRLFYITSPGVTLSGLTIKGGVEASHLALGGGIYMTAGLVSNCVIRECAAGGWGGGLYLNGGTVTRCTFATNFSVEWQYGAGGGAYVQSGLVDSCVFTSNRTTSWVGGGGVYLAGGAVRNCLIFRNTAECSNNDEADGGGVKVAGGQLDNCTIAENWAEDSGGGLVLTGGAATNCVVSFNSAAHKGTGTGKQDIEGATTTIGYSCSPDLTVGTNGNLASDPVFISTNAANYRLDRSSPCIEKGAALPWMTGSLDLDGRPRLQGKRPDMGAYEADAPRRGVVLMIY